jgi:lysozyme
MAKQNPMRAVQRKPVKKQVRTTTTRKKSSKKKKSSSSFMIITLITSVVLGAVLFAYHAYQEKKEERTISEFVLTIPEGFKSVGIDVSHHQGEINWKKVFAQSPLDTLIDFVYCKATEGSTHLDREWKTIEYN